MKKEVFLTLLLTLSVRLCMADGGMWLPILVGDHIKDMQSKGFRLSAEDVYSVNQECMKDAVLEFGGGCTGEIVSDKGLLFTNHHCGRSSIQSHSTLEHDYLTDGFWAESMEDELPCKGLTVSILQRMEEVPADKVNINDDRSVDAFIDKCREKYGSDNEYSLESFYAGNVCYLFVYKEFKDVRLVGAPPSAIGGFGGDTDNWMWPRHGGDFSVFRIYADKDNNPKEYAPDNVPYKPKHHFKISLKGVHEGDFTMVFGYPGTTEEYLPSYAVDVKANILMPSRVFVRQNVMDIMEEAINDSRAVRLKYTSRYNGVENAKKKWEGSIKGLRQYNAIARKQEFERQFTDKINANPLAKEEYGTLLSSYQKVYDNGKQLMRADAYFIESVYSTMQMKLGEKAYPLTVMDNNDSPAVIKDSAIKIVNTVNNICSQRDSALERKLFVRLYQIYTDSCASFMPDTFAIICQRNNIRNAEDFANYYYSHSLLADTAKFRATVNKYIGDTSLSEKKWDKNVNALKALMRSDIGVQLYYQMVRMYFDKIAPELSASFHTIDSLDMRYQEALLRVMPDEIQFPDANSTLRFAYGQVKGYDPRDAVSYKCFTTLDGVIAKDNPAIYDYHVPEKLKILYRNKDFGQYADSQDGKIHTCFVATNHTTGGNSGSPVVNADGELIGINFDRCWEGTMSDIMYNPDICRNISVDIRYVVFLIDKFGGASNIIAELDFAK